MRQFSAAFEASSTGSLQLITHMPCTQWCASGGPAAGAAVARMLLITAPDSVLPLPRRRCQSRTPRRAAQAQGASRACPPRGGAGSAGERESHEALWSKRCVYRRSLTVEPCVRKRNGRCGARLSAGGAAASMRERRVSYHHRRRACVSMLHSLEPTDRRRMERRLRQRHVRSGG